MFRGRRVPVQTYLAWVGARPIAVDQAIAGALPPPTTEQRDHLGGVSCRSRGSRMQLKLPSRLRKTRLKKVDNLSAHFRPGFSARDSIFIFRMGTILII